MIPSYSQLSIDVAVKAAIGFGVGLATQTNEKLWAIILATQALAQYALTKLGETQLGHKFRPAMIAESARTISYLVAIVALREAGLVSLRVAGLLGFFATAFLLGRIKHLSTETVK